MSNKKGSGSSMLQNIGSVLDPVTSYLGHAVSGKAKDWKSTTMGRMFTSPSAKKPDSKAGSAQALADAASTDAMMAAKDAEKKRLRAAAGRSSLIKTSGRGVLEPADIKKKKLLGE